MRVREEEEEEEEEEEIFNDHVLSYRLRVKLDVFHGSSLKIIIVNIFEIENVTH